MNKFWWAARSRCGRPALAALGGMLVLALLIMLPAPRVQAQDESQGQHRAGLVIVHGDGSVTQQCVAFAEESISGYELLKRSQRELSVEAGAIGATVCSIDGEGCSFPEQSCFCQCQGSPCVYWSYWRQSPTGWLYQNLGAGNTQVRDGDVEGWHWAEGTTRTAKEPPAVTFADLCGAAAESAGAEPVAVAATPAATDQAMTDQAMTDQATADQATATATPAGVQPAPAPVETTQLVTAGGTAAQGVTGQEALGVSSPVRLMWFVLLGLLVMPVAVLVVLALLRRRARH